MVCVLRLTVLGLLIGMGVATFAAVPPAAHAGVVDGVKTVGAFTVYLGAVPAAVVRGHPPAHAEAKMHGGAPPPALHAIHLVVAVFDKNSGRRVTDATVTARIRDHGRQPLAVPLGPMMIGGVTTFGGYTTLAEDTEYQISVDVLRRQRTKRQHPVTAQFTYRHD